MKTMLKRISSAILALAVIASLSPVSGSVILADEAETEAPAATAENESSKPEDSDRKDSGKPDSGKPKETEKEKTEEPEETEAPKAEADEPKETEKTEADVPEETEKPVSETPKGTDKPEADTPGETETKGPEKQVTNTPKKAPINVGTIKVNINKSTGIISWDKYTNAVRYELYIADAGSCEEPYENSYDLNPKIDEYVTNGQIEKSSSYPILLRAFDKYDNLIATWKGQYSYSTSSSNPSVGEIKNVKISKNGILTWDDYDYADSYDLFINGLCFWGVTANDKKDSECDLHYLIDYMIRQGEIDNKNPFSLKLVAYDDYYNVLAKWTKSYTYSTTATRSKSYTFDKVSFSKTNLVWTKIPGATGYDVCLTYDNGIDYSVGWAYVETNKADLNEEISKLIKSGDLVIPKTCSLKVELFAYDTNGTTISKWVGKYNFKIAANPLSVSGKKATVKYKKLKKKKQTLDISQVINGVDTGRGTMTFTKVKGNNKISINPTTGKVTIKKKGLKKKKTYKVTVKIKAAGNKGYLPSAEQTVTFKIKVK